MQKITFVQVNYRGMRGLSIFVLRGNLLREYPYSDKNAGLLIMVAERQGYTLSSDSNKMTIDVN